VSSEEDFTVGYYKGSCKLSVCSSADIEEVWKNVVKGGSVTLWCNGAKQTRNDTDSDEDVYHLAERRARD